MNSPFPGMDPYIEACGLWEDFHQSLTSEIQAALSRAVPDNYIVRMGERSYIVLTAPDTDPPVKKHAAQADVAATLAPHRVPGGGGASAAVIERNEIEVEDAAVEMQALVSVEFREVFIEISQLHPQRRLVTTVEVLSPSNKSSETVGWFQYLRKRQAHLEGGANLVEIDLLRGGRRMPMVDEWPQSPYYLLVCRTQRAPNCTVWPTHFLKPVPEIVVPLAPPDPDVPLALQPMIQAVYQRSRYSVDIDYREPCRPPLNDAHVKWLRERLPEQP